jgi:hypothetical protein
MPEETPNKTEEVISLAREVINDCEKPEVSFTALLPKAWRLAYLGGITEMSKWLEYEQHGYKPDDPDALKCAALVGRAQYASIDPGMFEPALILLNELGTVFQAHQGPLQLDPVTRGVVIYAAQRKQRIRTILGHVKSRIHEFATQVYYERLFSGAAQGIFDSYRAGVDGMLAKTAPEIPEMLPAVFERLEGGTQEEVSQALHTCRRILIAVADSLYTPSNTAVTIGGKPFQVGAKHYDNRLYVYAALRTQSRSRRERLYNSIFDLTVRINAGEHDDVTPQEARALVIQTYLLLGEMVTLPESPQPQTSDNVECQ